MRISTLTLLILFILGQANAEILKTRHRSAADYFKAWGSGDRSPTQEGEFLSFGHFVRILPDSSEIVKQSGIRGESQLKLWGNLPHGDAYSKPILISGQIWLFVQSGNAWNLYRASLNQPKSIWMKESTTLHAALIDFYLDEHSNPVILTRNANGKIYKQQGQITGGGKSIQWTSSEWITKAQFQQLQDQRKQDSMLAPLYGEFDLQNERSILSFGWNTYAANLKSVRFRLSPEEGEAYGPWSQPLSGNSVRIGQNARYLQYEIRPRSGLVNLQHQLPILTVSYHSNHENRLSENSLNGNSGGSSIGANSNRQNNHQSKILNSSSGSENGKSEFKYSNGNSQNSSSGQDENNSNPEGLNDASQNNTHEDATPNQKIANNQLTDQDTNVSKKSSKTEDASKPDQDQEKESSDSGQQSEQQSEDTSDDSLKNTQEKQDQLNQDEQNSNANSSQPNKPEQPEPNTPEGSASGQSKNPEEKNEDTNEAEQHSFQTEDPDSQTENVDSPTKDSTFNSNNIPENGMNPEDEDENDESEPQSETNKQGINENDGEGNNETPTLTPHANGMENFDEGAANSSPDLPPQPNMKPISVSSTSGSTLPSSVQSAGSAGGKAAYPSQGPTSQGQRGRVEPSSVPSGHGRGSGGISHGRSSDEIHSATSNVETVAFVASGIGNLGNQFGGSWNFPWWLLMLIVMGVAAYLVKKQYPKKTKQTLTEIIPSKSNYDEICSTLKPKVSGWKWVMMCQTNIVAATVFNGGFVFLSREGDIFKGPVDAFAPADSNLTDEHNAKNSIKRYKINGFFESPQIELYHNQLFVMQQWTDGKSRLIQYDLNQSGKVLKEKRETGFSKWMDHAERLHLAHGRLWLIGQKDEQPVLISSSLRKPKLNWQRHSSLDLNQYTQLCISRGQELLYGAIPKEDQNHLWFYGPKSNRDGVKPIAKSPVSGEEGFLIAEPKCICLAEMDPNHKGFEFQIVTRDQEGHFIGRGSNQISLPPDTRITHMIKEHGVLYVFTSQTDTNGQRAGIFVAHPSELLKSHSQAA